MAVGILAFILAMGAGLWSATKFVAEKTINLFSMLLSLFRSSIGWILTTAPRWFQILMFLFLFSLLGTVVINFPLNLMYVCTSNNELRHTSSAFGGLELMITSFSSENQTIECIGTIEERWCGAYYYNDSGICDAIGCSGFNSATGQCLDWIPYLGKDCEKFNISTCEYVQGCSEFFGNSTIFDELIISKTIPYEERSVDEPEGLFLIKCYSASPRLTLMGLDIFDFKIWILIYLIGIVIWFYRRSGKNE